MNAHHETNSVAFGMSGFLFAQHHCAEVLTTLDDVCSYTWDDRNDTTRFCEKNSSGTVIASGTYTYDSLDRRIGVDETSGGTTTQTWIVYNGDSNTPYAQFNGSGTLLERYLAGPSYVPGVTGMVARTNASGVTDWYLTGKLGSVRDIVNTSGTVIDHISYGAFGSIRAETNPSSGSQFKFDGMQYDTITGLYNDWHRIYDSATGRFNSLDPISFYSNTSNLYDYVGNSPITTIDFTGYEEVAPTTVPNIYPNQPTYNPNVFVQDLIYTPPQNLNLSNIQLYMWYKIQADREAKYWKNQEELWFKKQMAYQSQMEEMAMKFNYNADNILKLKAQIDINMQNSGSKDMYKFAIVAEIDLMKLFKTLFDAVSLAMNLQNQKNVHDMTYYILRNQEALKIYNSAVEQQIYWQKQSSRYESYAQTQQLLNSNQG